MKGTLPEIALRFCLSNPAVSTVIPGMRRVRSVESNCAVSDLGPLDLDVSGDSASNTPGKELLRLIVRIGLHTSIAGALERSALKAAELGANTFQIFSSSPRQWKASVPSAAGDQAAEARAREARSDAAGDPRQLPDQPRVGCTRACARSRSRRFAANWSARIAIGAEYLVAHPGNYKGQTVEQGILHFLEGVAAGRRTG